MTEPKKAAGLPLPEAMAGNFQDAARWFGQMWAAGTDASGMARGAAGPIPSMMMPTLDPHELEKRIADLRSVEHWLELNLGLLRTTIQGLEMQRAALAAWQGMSNAAGAAAPGRADAAGAAGAEALAAFQPAAWWNALQQQFAQMAASAAAKETPPTTPATPPVKPAAGKPKP